VPAARCGALAEKASIDAATTAGVTDTRTNTREGESPADGRPLCLACSAENDEARCTQCGAAQRVLGYRIEKVLHQNERGRPYLARDASGRSVALKELAFATVPDVETLDAFEREAAVLQKLQHPAVPRFIENFRVGLGVHMRLYMAQEFIEGSSLQDRLESHRFSKAETHAYPLASELMRTRRAHGSRRA
jgi:serine/threonine protein kinase